MTVSAVPAVIDALVTTLRAAFPSTVLVAGYPVQVFDGVGISDSDTGRQVWVGISDPFSDDPAPESASSEQAPPYASSAFRREELTIHLIAQASSGGDVMKTTRDAAYQIVNAVTTAIVNDYSLGGAVLMVRAINVLALRQNNDDKGTFAQVSFDVTAMAQFQGP